MSRSQRDRAHYHIEALTNAGLVVAVITEARSVVYPTLIAAYGEVAATNYAKVAKEFDTVATKFTAAAKQGDPEADGSAIVGQPDSVRQGRLDSAMHAAELD